MALTVSLTSVCELLAQGEGTVELLLGDRTSVSWLGYREGHKSSFSFCEYKNLRHKLSFLQLVIKINWFLICFYFAIF